MARGLSSLLVVFTVALVCVVPRARADEPASEGVTDASADATADAPSDVGAPTDDTPADAPMDEELDPAEAAKEAAREALRDAHVGELAAHTRRELQDARPLLRGGGPVGRVESALPNAEREIRRLSHPTRLARIPQLSQRELLDLRAEWRRHEDILEDWQATLAERSTELETARSELVELRRTWSALRDTASTAQSPPARQERIRVSFEQTRDTAHELDDARDRVLALSDRVTELSIVVADVMEQLRAATVAYRERLLVRDAPPLFEGLGRDEEEASLVAQAHASLLARTETPEELLHELVPPAILLAAAFVALTLAFWAFARAEARASQAAANTDAAAPPPHTSAPDATSATPGRSTLDASETVRAFSRELARHPGSAAALLVLLSAYVVVTHAPIVVYDALFFATLLPLARSMVPLAPPSLRGLARGVLGALALNRIESMLPEGSSLLRLSLLFEGAMVFALLVVWLRSQLDGERTHPATRFVRAVQVVAVAMATVQLVALGANVLGYVFFATVLLRGTGFSLYNAVALAGAVFVTEALVDLVIASPLAKHLRTLRDHGVLVRARSLRALSLVAFLAWTGATLEGYGLWTSFSEWASAVLASPLSVGSLALTPGAVLSALGILVATSFVLRFLRFVLDLDVLPRLRLEPGVDGAISGLTRYVVGGTGLLLALAALGIEPAQIALVAGALGVGIGFGLQGIVANFIAGIVLMLERPVRLGDFIEVGSLVGRVDRIGLRSSTVRGMDGAEVIVPNESLISREVVNWTLSDRRRRVEVKVATAHGTNPHDALAILRRVVFERANVVEGAEPRVLFDGFGAGSLDFTIQFWTETFADAVRLRSEVGLAVHDALHSAGILLVGESALALSPANESTAPQGAEGGDGTSGDAPPRNMK